VRIEDRNGGPALVDDTGLEVRRGDPLWVGLRLCFFDHAEQWPEVGPVMLMLLDQLGATAWQRTIGATREELGRLHRASPTRARPPSTAGVLVGDKLTPMSQSPITVNPVIPKRAGSVGSNVG
jgi:hypothetical protein